MIATEKEPTKAVIAQKHWQDAGNGVSSVVELREGDLRETLPGNLPESIDVVLLDSTFAEVAIIYLDWRLMLIF